MSDQRPDHKRTADHLMMAALLVLVLSVGTAVPLAACGQVVTPEPSPTPVPTDTPTATPSTPVQRSPTRVSSDSPPDIATPTITPTPIVHVVQKGDTLLDIAIDFGVSVEALQRANGIENPQLLQLGQRLVIPLDQEAGQTTAGLLLPTPTPHPIQVQGVAFYETPVDSLLGLGEVVNTTGITLTNVQVQVTILGAAGERLIETDTFACMDIVLPGIRYPFSVLFTTPPPDWVSHQVTVIRGQGAGALANAYVPMSVVEAEGRAAGPRFQVTGVVRNTSARGIAESVDIIVTTYDAEGSVTGFRRSPLTPEVIDEGLSPGEQVPFLLSLTTHGIPDDFFVTALGRAADEIAPGG